MRMEYDPTADVLTLILGDQAPVDAIEEPGGVIISYDERKEPVSVELLQASKRGFWQPGQPVPSFQPATSRG